VFHYVPTTCPYCATGCGLNLVVRDGRVVDTAPWHRSPVNEGKLCPKGAHAHEFINHPDRLTTPLVRKEGQLVPASWDEALDLVAAKFRSAPPGTTACLSSSRATNEDNYLFQKFARTVLLSPHVDNCARLCHSSSVTGLAMVFGSGAMTNSFDDIELSECIFVIGSNTLENHPLIGRRVILARQHGAKLIVADPRRTPLVKQADLHLPLLPGTDVALLNAMMQEILRQGWEDREFIAARTTGFTPMKDEVMQDRYSLENAARTCGVPAADIATAASWVAQSPSCSLLFAMGITQHAVGVDNVRSCANLQMLTGNVGNPGGGVNPLRGQNNVQGACDMGCLPDVFPGYQKVADPEVRKKFEAAWGCAVAEGPGLTHTDMIAVLESGTGPIRSMYVMGENPVLADPGCGNVPEALSNLDFLVVQDIFLSETAALADVVFPVAGFGERDGTQTSAERRVQRIRKAQEPGGEAKPDWQILCDIAARLGFGKQFTYADTAAIFREIASVTPQYAGMDYVRLDRPEALQWPCPARDHKGTPILHRERFATPDGKGIFTPISFRPPHEVPDAEYPLIFTNGRSIWHWHWGSMTHRSPSLERECPGAWLEIHPDDARAAGVRNGDTVRVSSRRGSVELPARVSAAIRPGVVFMPIHFGKTAVNLLTNPALDPFCRIPEFKACAVKVEKVTEERAA
jgi:formate dehydrogenase major subunit